TVAGGPPAKDNRCTALDALKKSFSPSRTMAQGDDAEVVITEGSPPAAIFTIVPPSPSVTDAATYTAPPSSMLTARGRPATVATIPIAPVPSFGTRWTTPLAVARTTCAPSTAIDAAGAARSAIASSGPPSRG